jgi:hypothetical protein
MKAAWLNLVVGVVVDVLVHVLVQHRDASV